MVDKFMHNTPFFFHSIIHPFFHYINSITQKNLLVKCFFSVFVFFNLRWQRHEAKAHRVILHHKKRTPCGVPFCVEQVNENRTKKNTYLAIKVNIAPLNNDDTTL